LRSGAINRIIRDDARGNHGDEFVCAYGHCCEYSDDFVCAYGHCGDCGDACESCRDDIVCAYGHYCDYCASDDVARSTYFDFDVGFGIHDSAHHAYTATGCFSS
jgi:hypothetical protein